MAPFYDGDHIEHERRLQRLIRRLPGKIQKTTRWLRRPASRWARIPAGVVLIIGGCLSILPFFGLWMLPLGLMLLADDIPPLRRARGRALGWIARRRPAGSPRPAARPDRRPPRPPKNQAIRGNRRRPRTIDFTTFLTHF